MSVPEDWARTTHGDATVFTDKFNSVRVEAVPHARMLFQELSWL